MVGSGRMSSSRPPPPAGGAAEAGIAPRAATVRAGGREFGTTPVLSAWCQNFSNAAEYRERPAGAMTDAAPGAPEAPPGTRPPAPGPGGATLGAPARPPAPPPPAAPPAAAPPAGPAGPVAR